MCGLRGEYTCCEISCDLCDSTCVHRVKTCNKIKKELLCACESKPSINPNDYFTRRRLWPNEIYRNLITDPNPMEIKTHHWFVGVHTRTKNEVMRDLFLGVTIFVCTTASFSVCRLRPCMCYEKQKNFVTHPSQTITSSVKDGKQTRR